MRVWIVAMALLIGCKSGASKPAPDAKPEAPSELTIAKEFMTHVARGEADAAVAMMAVAPRPAEIIALWKEVAPDAGELVEVIATADPADARRVNVAAHMKWGWVQAVAGVKDGKVVRFSCKPIYIDPAYVNNQFHEEEVAIGSGPTALRGILTTPGGKGPWPVVLLVQGSGPSDLDEWAPGLKVMPFRDLADGLASFGVAALRVDKATWGDRAIARKMDNATITVKEEYFDPVGDALAFLTKRFDHVFVLGHSMAGWLLPWIMKDHPEIDGGIIAAGNARNLGDLLVEQDQWLAQVNNPSITEAELAILKAIDEDKVKRIHDPNLAEDTDPQLLPFGSPAHGWKFVQSYDAPATIAAIDRPFLLLQGGRDYNVTMVDHEMWKKALEGKAVTAKAYPNLNHVFQEGTGKAKPEELKSNVYVAEVVVTDIADWVKAQK